MTTTILGRLLLHLRRTECRPPSSLTRDPASDQFGYDPALISPSTADADADPDMADTEMAEWDHRRERAISPFGLIPLAKRMSGGSAHSSASYPDVPVPARGVRTESLSESFDDVIHIAPPAYHYRKRAHDPSESLPLSSPSPYPSPARFSFSPASER